METPAPPEVKQGNHPLEKWASFDSDQPHPGIALIQVTKLLLRQLPADVFLLGCCLS